LATIRPTQPDPVWAAALTGMYPWKSGIRSAAAYYAWGDDRPVDVLPDHCFSHALVSLGIVRDVPNSSTAWRSRPLWNILSDAGVSVGIVRWPLSYPAQPVLGFMVADRFHDVIGSALEFDRAAYPAEIVPMARASFSSDADPERSEGEAAAAVDDAATLRDRSYSHALQSLRQESNPQLFGLRYQALDQVGHRFWSAAQPRTARDPSEEQRRVAAQILERAYLAADAEVGDAMASLTPNDLLLVVSGFGMQRLNPLKQMFGELIGEGGVSGTHERAPDGFLLAFGTAVERGRRPRGSIVDVAPTILYYLGLPVGRDMDGFARSDLFTRAFTAERPIAFIPTHNR
jgi:predicted AlkP superfamily phosphohydrolase/phosphomutase